jgi:hypothetical protein
MFKHQVVVPALVNTVLLAVFAFVGVKLLATAPVFM